MSDFTNLPSSVWNLQPLRLESDSSLALHKCPVVMFFNYFSLFKVLRVNRYLVNWCNCSSWNTHVVLWGKKKKSKGRWIDLRPDSWLVGLRFAYFPVLLRLHLWFDTQDIRFLNLSFSALLAKIEDGDCVSESRCCSRVSFENKLLTFLQSCVW